MSSTPGETTGIREQFTRLLRWAGASLVLAVMLAGCGGGGEPVAPTAAQAVPADVVAMATMQQSVSQRIALPRRAAMAAVAPGTATENFEAGMADWSNWGNAQVVAGAGTSGSNALQVATGAGGAGLMVSGITPGTSYRLTAQVRVSDPSERVGIGINFLDAAGNFLIGRNSSLVSNTGYAAVTIDQVAPANASLAVVWIWKNDGSGYAILDDVVFGPGDAPPPPPSTPPASNLLTNGGFESGMTGWVDWGNTRIVSDPVNSGALALSVGPAAGGAGHDVDGIVPGTTYRLGVSAKVSDASEIVFVGVNFLDQAGSVVGSTQQSTSSTSYAPISADIIAPTAAVRAVVYVWKNAGSGLGYVDDYVFGVASGSMPPPVSQVSPNLVVNGDFEQGLSSWENWGSTVIASTATRAQVGTDPGGIGQIIPGIVPGKTYRLSAQVGLSVLGTGQVGYLGLKFLDSAGHVVQDRTSAFTSNYLTEILAVAPANATSALVFVWKNAGNFFAFLDDVILVQPPDLQSAPAPTVQLSGTSTLVWLDAVAGALGSVGAARLTAGDALFAWSRSGDRANTNGGILCYSARWSANSAAFGTSACLPGSLAGSFTGARLPIQVLPRPDNSFVIAWRNPGGFPDVPSGSQYQVFDAFARPVGGIQAGSPPQGDVALTGGGYVSLVGQRDQFAPDTLLLQRRSSDGTPIGPLMPVGDTNGTDAQIVALTGGGFAVAWTEMAPQPAGFSAGIPVVVSRMFNADGTAVGRPMVVAGGTAPVCSSNTGCPFEILQSLAPMDDGGYLVAWTSGSSPGPIVEGTFVRRFRADGTPGPAVGKLDDGPTVFRTGRLDRLAIVANGPDSFAAAWPRNDGREFSQSVPDITPHVFDATPLR